MLSIQLKQNNISPSVHRMAIYGYMLEHRTHPRVEDVYSALSPTMPTLSKTTVYNTLKLFAEKSLVQSITISDKCVRFDADMSQHAHFICKECEQIFDLPYKSVEADGVEGFNIEQTQVYYKGICPKCLIK